MWASYRPRMPILKPCSAPGCAVLTIGRLCVEHEREQALAAAERTLPRGRPYVAAAAGK